MQTELEFVVTNYHPEMSEKERHKRLYEIAENVATIMEAAYEKSDLCATVKG